MIIRGGNLGEREAEYKPLSEYTYFKDERQDIVKRIEQFYLKLLEESKKIEVKPFPQENGKAVIKPGMINHRCSNSLDALEGISKYGILATEWFGIRESEGEGIFCSFVERIHDENNHDEGRQQQAKILNLRRIKTIGNFVILFLDSTNPIMEKLLRLDYFEFERVKQQEPENLSERYSEEEIELFESVIEPFSKGGRKYHVNKTLPYCDWSAIPGGIPSALVNGICTKRSNYTKEDIEEIAKLFPNATIFNGELEVIHTPEKEKNEFLKRIAVKPEELNQNVGEPKIQTTSGIEEPSIGD